MARAGKIFRVFVSSTFSDLKAERNALQEHVFPKLRELCMQRGCRFQAIDLRWGVSEEASVDQQAMPICLEELHRCQEVTPRPNFIVLLGQRYGWLPIPPYIPADEFENISRHITADNEKKLVSQWYRLDENAMPRGEYVLQPRTGIDGDTWYPVERELHAILLNAARKAGLPEENLIKYERSATEQEINEGALKAGTDDAFCYFREIGNLPEDKRAKDFRDFGEDKKQDQTAKERLDNLKRRLREHFPKDQVYDYEAEWSEGGVTDHHLDALCERVEADLREAILEEIESIEEKTDLEQEIDSHQKFRDDRAQHFIGRETIIKIILGYVQKGDNHPLVVYGPSGSGKSALIARCVQRVEEENPKAVLIHRFIGASAASTDIRSLLETLCNQIYKVFKFEQEKERLLVEIGTGEGKEDKWREIEEEYSIPSDMQKLPKTFKNFMTKIPEKKNLLLVLDALDQLSPSNNAHSLNWLPNELPGNVRIVVSVLDREGAAGECLRKANVKLPQESLIELKPLTVKQGEEILDTWLKKAIPERTLQKEQRADVIEKFKQCKLPLYLKLAFEEARRWHSNGLPCGADDVPGLNADIEGVILDLLARLAKPANHGEVMVSKALGYLAAARYGLTEDELLDVLSDDKKIMADFKRRSPKSPDIDHIPVVVWSRLYHDLEPYFTERAADGTSLMSFYHRQFGEVITAKYASGDEKAPLHKKLAEYFGVKAHEFDVDEKGKTPNLRKMSELPYQQTYGEQWEPLEETLTDLVFIEAKCTAGMAYDLVSDYDRINVGRARPGPIIKTAWKHLGKLGIWCPHCLAWFKIKESQLDTVITCPGCGSKLKINPFIIEAEWHPCKPKREVPQKEGIPDALVSSDVGEFADFIRNQTHILKEYPGLTFQQAANQPDRLAPARRVKQRLDSKAETRPWLRWVNKPQHRDPCVTTISGHSQSVNACSYSPDGRRILSPSGKTLKLWDAENGEEIAALSGQAGIVNACAYSPDGRRIVSASRRTLKVWDAETSEEITALSGHSQSVYACSYSPDGNRIVSASWDETIKVWESESGEEIATLFGHSGWVNACSYSPDGRRIASASNDETLKLWDAESGEEIATLSGHTSPVKACSYSPDGRCIVSGSMDGTLKVWDAESGEEIAALSGHSHSVNACSYSPDGNRIVSASSDETIKVWESESGEEIATLSGHSGWMKACAYSTDGRRIVSGSEDETLKVWDAKSGGEITKLPRHSWVVGACSYSPDSRRIASGSCDYTVKLWDVESGGEIATLSGHSDWVKACSYSPDGRRIVSGSRDLTLKVWDAESGEEITTLSGHPDWVNACSYSPDGRRIVSGSDDETLKVWDAESGEEIATLSGHSDSIETCSYSPDGRRIVSASADGDLKVWDTGSEENISTLSGHSSTVIVCSYSPDGRRIVSGSWDKTLKVWDAECGEEMVTLSGHLDHVRACSYSPDGRRIVSGSEDKTLKVWDTESGKEIYTRSGHSGTVNVCSYSLDGRLIISGSNDKTVTIWDGESGKVLLSFMAAHRVASVTFGVSSREAVVGTENGFIHILHLRNICIGPPILTPWHSDVDDTHAFGCVFCRNWSEIPESALGTELDCPKCGERVKLNPFTINADWRPIAKGWGDDSHTVSGQGVRP